MTRTEKRRAYQAEYYRRNKDKMDGSSKRWREENALASKKHGATYRDKNPEKEKERLRRYREKNRETINAKAKERRKANPEKVKEIDRRSKRNNPETVLKSYAKRKSYGDLSLPKGTIATMMARQNGKCNACGRCIRKKRHVDHIVALAKGGTHEISNLQLLCVPCNCAKGAKDNDQFLAELRLPS